MLDAAEHVLRTRGIAQATTKHIAAQAGFSEAALYKHFQDKADLFLAVLRERSPSDFGSLLEALSDQVGRGTVAATVQAVAQAALDFYLDTFPMAVSVFSDVRLLAAHRDAVVARGAGPRSPTTVLSAYFEAERQAGRIDQKTDPHAAASLLLGACFQHAFLVHFSGDDPNEEFTRDFAARLTATLLTGLVRSERSG
jgi:AcrR family transcriptional regulator